MPKTNQNPVVPPSAVDATSGKVKVWDIPKGVWVYRHVVDAKESIKVGTCSMDGPLVPCKGPGGDIMICECEIEDYQKKKGYKVGKLPEPVPLEISEDGDDDDDGPFDFSGYSKADLLGFAEKANLDASGLSKADLISALDSSGYTPS